MAALQYFQIILFILGVSAAPSEKAYFLDKCSVEDIPSNDLSTYHINKNVFKEDYSGIVAEFPSTGITGVYVDEGIYLGVSIKNDKIVIETTEYFSNFEKDTGPINRQIQFSTYIVFECVNGTSRLNFIQPIIDINNHSPYFNKASYEFKFGMSLKQGFVLNKHITIAGMDDDLTKAPIEFEISGDALKIERDTTSIDRGNSATITLGKDIEMPSDQEFEITITDQGETPFKSIKAKLRLILTADSKSIVSPLFTKPLWLWQYDKVQKIISSSEQVTLSQGYGTGLKIKQIGYEDYFETTLDDPSKERVLIKLKTNLTQDIVKEKHIFINLEAEFANAKQIGKTTILIEMV